VRSGVVELRFPDVFKAAHAVIAGVGSRGVVGRGHAGASGSARPDERVTSSTATRLA